MSTWLLKVSFLSKKTPSHLIVWMGVIVRGRVESGLRLRCGSLFGVFVRFLEKCISSVLSESILSPSSCNHWMTVLAACSSLVTLEEGKLVVASKRMSSTYDFKEEFGM